MPRKKNYEVWNNFLHRPDSTTVKCKHCEKEYKINNATKMAHHLINCFRCPVVVKNKLKKSTRAEIAHLSGQATSSDTSRETSLNTSGEVSQQESSTAADTSGSLPEITGDKIKHIDLLLSKAIFVTGAPLSMVEHELWIQLFKEIIPQYKLPSRKAISTTYLDTIYKETEKEINEELKSANNLHLQCDGWSNVRNEGVLNFIICKPEPFFVKSVDTSINRHTSTYLSQEILKVIDVYGNKKFLTVVGDNASNIQRAFQLVQEKYPHITPLRCVAHTLNLLCEDCLKIPPIKAFISITIDTIKHIKKSQVLNSLLAKIVQEKGCGESLKLPCKTRWGSYFNSLKSLQNTKVALRTLAVHEDTNVTNEIKTNLLDDSFWTMIEDCIKIFEPIVLKIFKLQGNGIVTNEVYMTFKEIHHTLSYILPEIVMLNNDQKQKILDAVNTRMISCVKPIHYAAYLLDPKTQGVELDEEHEIDAMECVNSVAQSLNIDVTPDLAIYRAKQGLFGKSFLWQSVEGMDPIAWWMGLCRSKLLSRVAVRILTAPSTSAATERSFSTLGHIHSNKRNRLTTERAAKISYISYNWNLLHKQKDEYGEEDDSIATTAINSPMTSPITVEEGATFQEDTEDLLYINVNEDSSNTSDSD